MFSPYYARARRRGAADPRNHCALNVCLYGPRGARWAMTERGSAALHAEAEQMQIGPSRVRWQHDALSFDIDELAVPLPRRVRGRVCVKPNALAHHPVTLDTAERHVWSVIAPRARVEVELSAPELSWKGSGYLDSNYGSEPLEARLRGWNWSRTAGGEHTDVIYDLEERSGARGATALRFDAAGAAHPIHAPTQVQLPVTGWRIARCTRSQNAQASVVKTLEDTPFYARSLIRHQLDGQQVQSFHEALDLDRFASSVVQMMLPFRMPRRRG